MTGSLPRPPSTRNEYSRSCERPLAQGYAPCLLTAGAKDRDFQDDGQRERNLYTGFKVTNAAHVVGPSAKSAAIFTDYIQP